MDKHKKTQKNNNKKQEAKQTKNNHTSSPQPKRDPKDIKIEELTILLKHLQADFENYKKRVETEKKDIFKYAAKDIVNKMLPVLDNFNLALSNATPTKEFVKGVEMIHSQFLLTLEKEGLKPIPIQDTKFDPNLHEALLQAPSKKSKGTIIEEIQKGYFFNDKILRHSRVKVSAGPEEMEKDENNTPEE